MKVAIPCDGNNINDNICVSFGRCPYFVVVDTETMNFESVENTAANAQGGAGLKAAQTVADTGAKAVITMRCGQNSADVLKMANIKLYAAPLDTVKNLVEKFNSGSLEQLTNIHPGFHGVNN